MQMIKWKMWLDCSPEQKFSLKLLYPEMWTLTVHFLLLGIKTLNVSLFLCTDSFSSFERGILSFSGSSLFIGLKERLQQTGSILFNFISALQICCPRFFSGFQNQCISRWWKTGHQQSRADPLYVKMDVHSTLNIQPKTNTAFWISRNVLSL